MQPSYTLLPATIYPKTFGGMCYAIIEITLIGLKQPVVASQSQAGKLDTLSQHAKCRQVIPVCSCPITGQAN